VWVCRARAVVGVTPSTCWSRTVCTSRRRCCVDVVSGAHHGRGCVVGARCGRAARSVGCAAGAFVDARARDARRTPAQARAAGHRTRASVRYGGAGTRARPGAGQAGRVYRAESREHRRARYGISACPPASGARCRCRWCRRVPLTCHEADRVPEVWVRGRIIRRALCSLCLVLANLRSSFHCAGSCAAR
jgi:hypothetical protein